MKVLSFLPLITLSASFVIPSEEVLRAFDEDYDKKNSGYSIQNGEQSIDVQNPLDVTLDSLTDLPTEDSSQSGFDIEFWVNRLKDYVLDCLHDGPEHETGYASAKDEEEEGVPVLLNQP